MKKKCTNSKCRKTFTVKENDIVVCPWCGKKYPGLKGKKSRIPDVYRVVMTGDGHQKVKAIKIIREYLGIELKEAKGLADQLSEKPVVLKDDLTYAEACAVKDEIFKSTGIFEIEILKK